MFGCHIDGHCGFESCDQYENTILNAQCVVFILYSSPYYKKDQLFLIFKVLLKSNETI